MSGNCIKHTDSPIPLIDAYTAQALTIPERFVGTPDGDAGQYILDEQYYSSILVDAYSSFLNYEGLEGCTALIPPSQSYPTFIGREAVASATAYSATNSAGSSTHGDLVGTRQIIILSSVLSTVGIIILLLSFILIRRYRKKKRSQAADPNHPKSSSYTQLYVDQKAELENDERKRHELEAGGIVHEMEGEDAVFEVPGDGNSRNQSASSHSPRELRGPDHAQELEVPGNI